MEEIARGVQAPTKGEALAVALIPYILAWFETCEAPRRGTVDAGSVPMLGRVETPTGREGIVAIAA